MNIDLVKWMCDKADGFEWKVGTGIEGVRYNKTIAFFNDREIKGEISKICSELWPSVYYPMLRQKAIDGINSLGLEHLTVSYIASYGWIWLTSNKEDMSSESSDIYYDTADDARTALLEKRHEQETNK